MYKKIFGIVVVILAAWLLVSVVGSIGLVLLLAHPAATAAVVVASLLIYLNWRSQQGRRSEPPKGQSKGPAQPLETH